MSQPKRSSLLQQVYQAAASTLEPPGESSIADWGRANLVLPVGTAEPGPLVPERTPYLIDFMAAATDPRYRTICLVCATQMAKTTADLCVMGYYWAVDASPMIFIAPNQRLSESVAKTRILPMVKSIPALYERLDRRRSRLKAGEFFIAGQRFGIAWAGSAVELASHAVRIVFMDELDKMPVNVEGEGNAFSLASARTATYADGKVICTSSPTTEGASAIESLYLSGTRLRWEWPCPTCGQYFAPTRDLLWWPEKASPALAKREARLLCPNADCEASNPESAIPDGAKGWMNARGRYAPEEGGDPESDVASYWVPGIASPWRSFGELARDWINAARSHDQETIKAVLNTRFAELYKMRGEAPAAEVVKALRCDYRMDELPAGVLKISCGCDVQQDRIFYAIRGWGAGATSWLLRHGELIGDTARTDAPCWEQLASFFEERWGDLAITFMMIDSGFRPDPVYSFARRFIGRCLPSKGRDTQAKRVDVQPIDVTRSGKPARRGTQLAFINTSYFKSALHSHLLCPLGQTGAWHLPSDCTNDYCEALVSESAIAGPRGVVWVYDRKVPNHYLDAEILNLACADLLHIRTTFTPQHHPAAPAAVESSQQGATAPPAPVQPPQPPPPSPAPRRNPNSLAAKMNHPGFGRPAGGRNWAMSWRK